jgi:hypothetical protein
MSNFACETCGRTQVDSPTGYVAGCAHHPPEHDEYVTVFFGGDTPAVAAFYSCGAWYRSRAAFILGTPVHPIEWKS